MPNRIAKKLITILIVFSSLLTLLFTALQIYFEYERDIHEVQTYFKQIELSYLKSISENVWEEDRGRLLLLINGIVEFPGFEYAQVIDSNGAVLATTGAIPHGKFISKTYPLRYSFRNRELNIGKLEAAAGLSGIYQRLYQRVGIILLSNALKTLLVATFLFFVIKWLLTNQLDLMNQFAKNLKLPLIPQPLKLNRGPLRGGHDEVDQLAESLNEMQQTLSRTYQSLEESEQRFRQLAENIQEVFWLGAPDWSEIYYISPAYEKYWGLKAQDVYDDPLAWLDSVHPQDRGRVLAEIPKNPQNIAEYLDFREYRVIKPDGRILWAKARAYPIRDEQGKVVRIAGIVKDITQRRQAEEELRKLSRAIESSSSAVFISGRDGRIEYVNPKFTELTGFTRDEASDKHAEFLCKRTPGDAAYAAFVNAIVEGREWKGELDFIRKNGSEYRARLSISEVRDPASRVTHFIGIHEDITQEYKLTEQLNHQASHDALTGLYNRMEFERQSERLLGEISQFDTEHALCFMDLDQFKIINDTCGHLAGDELLRQISRLLEETVRHSDILARLGGDEFGVLMRHCSLEQAHRLAESIRKNIQDYRFIWEGQYFQVGISIGLVAIKQDTASLTELLKQADTACYMAKELGRNRIHEFHREDSKLEQRQGEMLWVNRINQALEDGRLRLYAQPIVSLYGGKEKHYELLIRMIDEAGKVIPPGAFLPAAERFGLIGKLDVWVVNKAFDLLAANPAFVEQTEFLSINLSGVSLTSSAFLEHIFSRLNQSKVPASKICFEVTETVAITNLSAAITFIDLLKLSGFRFALDDFGSGLSSFGYLKNLPVDFLKIDGMFVKDIVGDDINYAMVKSINDIGKVMGMQTIAEFVENDQITEKLIEIGVDYVQGYNVGKPEPFDELVKQGQAGSLLANSK